MTDLTTFQCSKQENQFVCYCMHNTPSLDPKSVTNLDSIVGYIWELLAQKAQSFGALPTALPSSDCKKSITPRKQKTQINQSYKLIQINLGIRI